jgi:hypothetical protein
MVNFFAKFWYIFVILGLAILCFFQHKKITELEKPKIYVEDPKLKNLRDSVDLLVQQTIEWQTKYDSKQSELINNINQNNQKSDAKIIIIPKYTDAQRDSVWASKSNSKKDSIPKGYWNILEQKTGGKNIRGLGVQGDIPRKPR